ncbi:MAG: sigma-54-dependent Fis family transcriptional regulator [Devosia sp.]|uniref:sigma-54-dependent transcriptional regulator n=1 Tax=Devosia sp. 66-22 TaxID=1895753 RepID=UPI00092B3E26|nr:sigma-54 dependent transcriptional regulator [Devosia sp. 66-22]MBN9345641.1 sigma-54-dependent Fis family transcriptional regulator [Devosia sp.]OJX53162.1 MAG: sigma-54-dependent Fis family transcriptional regulator [Devosia sp. 66-22]
MMTRVLIVDDDPVQLRLTSEVARRAGFTPVTADGGDEALRLLRGSPGFGAVILDLVMPDRDGMAVMEAMARDSITAPVIIQTAHSSLETVVSAMRQGAVDFFVKPVAPERLIVSLRNALKLDALETVVRSERNRRAGTLGLDDIVTRSPALHRVLTLSQKAAKSQIPVLIEGETGTGKELIARVIQGMSDRATKPFVTVNCSAIPANLIESTLFGHKKGAFTGAVADHVGKFAEAHGGTLFLDEIGELPPEAQAKLLRALQEGEIEPVGAARPERVNVRVISATNRRLLGLAQTGEFREDLYYRLNVFPIYLPPLRERAEDIEPLAAHFIARFAAEAGKRIAGLSAPALELLRGYNWPGNIRQLENAVYRAIVLSDGGYLELADFPQIVAQERGRDETLKLTEQLPAPSAPVHIDAVRSRRESEAKDSIPDRFLDARGEVAPLPDLERELIAFALKHYGGRMSKVARALKIGRSTLYRKLRDYGLEDGVESDAA